MARPPTAPGPAEDGAFVPSGGGGFPSSLHLACLLPYLDGWTRCKSCAQTRTSRFPVRYCCLAMPQQSFPSIRGPARSQELSPRHDLTSLLMGYPGVEKEEAGPGAGPTLPLTCHDLSKEVFCACRKLIEQFSDLRGRTVQPSQLPPQPGSHRPSSEFYGGHKYKEGD